MGAALDNLSADLDRAIGGFLGRLSQEEVHGDVGDIIVTMQLDGEISDIDIPDHVLRRSTAYEIGETFLAAIRDANHKAAARRKEIADAIQVMGEPVSEIAQQLTEDPAGTARRLSRPTW